MAKLAGFMKVSRWERDPSTNELIVVVTVNKRHPEYWLLWLRATVYAFGYAVRATLRGG